MDREVFEGGVGIELASIRMGEHVILSIEEGDNVFGVVDVRLQC